MKIAFLHYHLRTGGVTTVLQQQIKAVSQSCEAMLLTGESIVSAGSITTRTIPGIGYDIKGDMERDHRTVADTVVNAIFGHWPDGCDILHVHNPTLAKNKDFLKILKVIQSRGITLFLQIHDFAEDGRPQAYFHDEPYPKNCHYGVINSRDYNILLSCGLKPSGLHRVFNTITALPRNASDIISPYILYTVRAIRRKNIGEAILLSTFLPRGESLQITLPPNSSRDWKSYNDWKRFVRSHRLPVRFEAGVQQDFSDLIGHARCLVTTSITEGFGFTFLEPWTAGKLLWGRKLPEICRDFEKAGVDLDHLYSSIRIPLAWINVKAFFDNWQTAFQKACHKFDIVPPNKEINQFIDGIISDNRIDFGFLDEPFQQQVLSRIIKDRSARRGLIALNPFLEKPGYVKNPIELIGKNQRVVLDTYTESAYTENLLAVYQKIITTPVRQQIDRQLLLRWFLQPDRFSLLKWGIHAG